MPAERFVTGSGPAAAPLERLEKPDRRMSVVGWVLSGLAIAFFLFDAGLKLVAPQFAIDSSPPGLGWPLEIGMMRTLGVLLLIPTLLYLWPRTALLGAVLITGYLGDSDTFDRAIADFAVAYAEQSEKDHQAVMNAVRAGKLEAEIERD